MALAGYPQTHLSPELEIVTTQSDTVQYEGPFSSLKVLGDGTSDYAVIWIYLDSEGYNKTSQVSGVDYFIVNALATDSIPGPIYGFRMHTGSSTNTTVVGYRYSSDIL